MDAVTKAISEIKYAIPPQLLQLVFSPVQRQYFSGYRPQDIYAGIDSALKEKIINGRVRQDCDIAGALEVEIPIAGLQIESIERFAHVIRVPKSYTQGREITSVLALAGGYSNSAAPSSYSPSLLAGGNALMDQTMGIMNSQMPIYVNQTASVSLIGDNVVLIEDYLPLQSNLALRCLVGHDSQFSAIKPQSLIAFGQLAVLATKAYIFNNFYLEIGAGQLLGGQDFGQIKDLVDEYRDANQLYAEYYQERWRKISFMNDNGRHNRFVKMLTGGLG